MVKVSVIIPVYNMEEYLKQCLDSVLAQTLKEIEVICVDDGSTDSSPRILDEYAAGWKNVTVIHKENGGVVSARRAGEAVASGEYIGYVDSDDWVDERMYECLYTYAVNSGADMVTSGYFQEGNYVSELFDGVEPGLYEDDFIGVLRDCAIYSMCKKAAGIRGSLCCKLISGKLLEKVKIPDDISMSEDKLQVLSCILECRSVLVLKEAYYHYRINPKSATHVGNPSYLLCVDKVYQYFRKLYEHPNFTARMRTQAELYMMELILAGINTRLGFETRNLLWFDPSWLDRIPEGSRIVFYGGGEAEEKYRKQLMARGTHIYVGRVDFEYERYCGESMGIESPLRLDPAGYDYIVITIKNPGKASGIRERLEEAGIEARKILWFEQRELFWKYAEAEGLLGGET